MFDIERLRTHESFASNKIIIEGQFLDKQADPTCSWPLTATDVPSRQRRLIQLTTEWRIILTNLVISAGNRTRYLRIHSRYVASDFTLKEIFYNE